MLNLQSVVSKFVRVTVTTIGFSLIATGASALSLVGTSGQFNGGGSEVLWGTSMGQGRSGLGFTGVGAISPLPNNEPFLLGTLEHFNNPISGSVPSSVNLAITLDFDVVRPVFDITFRINETLNSPIECPAEPNPCPDIIAWDNLFFDGTFSDGSGSEYNFQLLGFTGGQTEFVSQEGGTSSAELYGQISRVSSVPTPAVMLPIVMSMFGAASRRKDQVETTEIQKEDKYLI